MKLSVFKIKLLLLSFQLLIASPRLAAFSGAASTSETPKADILKSKFVRSLQKIKDRLQDTSKKIAHKLGIKNFDSKLDAPFELGDKAIIRTAKILDKSLEILDDESFWPWIGCGVGAAAGGALGALGGGAVAAGLSVSTVGMGAPAAAAIGAAISAAGFGLGSAVGPAATILICRASRLARNKLFEEQTAAEQKLAENKKSGADATTQSDRPLDDIILGLQGSISAGYDGKLKNITNRLEKYITQERLAVNQEKLATFSGQANSKSDTLVIYRSDKTLYFTVHGFSQSINLPSLRDIPFYYSSGIFPTMEILGGFFVKADGEKLDTRDMTSIVRQMFDPKKLKLNIEITGDMPTNPGSLIVFFQIDKKIYVQIIDNKSSAVITPKNLVNAHLVIDFEKESMPIDHEMLQQSKQDAQSVVKKLQEQQTEAHGAATTD